DSDRRAFLRRAALGGAAVAGAPLLAGAAGKESAPSSDPPRVRRRVRLGRTGLEIPDVSFGSSRLRGDEGLVRHALARGITYFDTAETYTGGASEETLGRALAGRRDEVVLASKTKCGARTSREELFRALEGSLRRLRTDRIDVYFNHAVNDRDRLRNEEWLEFADRARAQGKIRFTGMSGHGGRLVECLDLALDEDLVDVILVAFNFGQDPAFYEGFTRSFDFVATQPDLPRALAKAREKQVGVVAMKTLRGARLNDMRPYETGDATFAQAALRWTLSHPHSDALVVSMTSREEVDEYLGASGWTGLASGDRRLLVRYAHATDALACRYGCDACAGACPHGVAIPDLLRARMYAEDYGDAALAREALTEALPSDGTAPCLACDGRPCADACAYGLPLASLARRTARRRSA
ncbi:MAG: aldo/keto reductase, partial [Myxococcota bacterium]|nr:aldo/keto reductase [Myxococcota bacterium]